MRNKLIIIGSFVLAVVVLVTYFPAQSIGFIGEDVTVLKLAAGLPLSDYLAHWFDPRLQTIWYRPAQGIQFLLEYYLFHSNPVGYHVSQILLHLVNCYLLVVLVARLSHNWRIAFVAGLLYGGLPILAFNILFPLAADPLAVFFYLIAALLWTFYLQSGRREFYWLTLGAAAFAILSKEISVTLPVVLFLLDYFVIRTRATWVEWIRRYAPFTIVVLPYLAVQRYIQTQGWFVYAAGFQFGIHMIPNLIDSLGTLVFPWTTSDRLNSNLLNYVSLAAVLILFTYQIVKRRDPVWVFLGLFALLTVMPTTGFSNRWYLQARFLYLPVLATTVAPALLFDAGRSHLSWRKWYRLVAAAVITLVIFVSSQLTTEIMTNYAEIHRKTRVPIRDISVLHPTFPADSYLYFIVPPGSNFVADTWAAFWQRFGDNVIVASTTSNRQALLRDHNVAYVYYFDESGRPIEVAVDKASPAIASTAFPVDFQVPIRLEGEEVVNSTVKRGENLVVLLYWKATGSIDKDYTVFAHLIDEKGEMVAGYDSLPQLGRSPTTSWQPDRIIPDSILLPITPDIPAGNHYRLEVGLYYLPTMQRIGMVDAAGQVITDSVVIAPFSVVD